MLAVTSMQATTCISRPPLVVCPLGSGACTAAPHPSPFIRCEDMHACSISIPGCKGMTPIFVRHEVGFWTMARYLQPASCSLMPTSTHRPTHSTALLRGIRQPAGEIQRIGRYAPPLFLLARVHICAIMLGGCACMAVRTWRAWLCVHGVHGCTYMAYMAVRAWRACWACVHGVRAWRACS